MKIKVNTFVAIAALTGAIFRWQLDKVFFVNILGCFLLGLVNSLSISKRYKLIFGVAFCGSLTTFSGWILQLFELIESGLYLFFFSSILKIVLIGIFAVYLGDLLGKQINRLH